MSPPISQNGNSDKYRYVVLTAAFVALMFNASLDYISGVLHVALLEEYQFEEEATVWLGSLFFCMFGLGGPIASFIINVSDCRTCVFLSGILGLIGFSVNVFITDITWLYFTYAFLAGAGNALSHTGSLVVLGYYFREDIGLASGIAVCGFSAGLFIHPRLSQFLIDTYTLRYAYPIIGAIAFHSSVAGLLMTPTKFEKERHTKVFSGRPKRLGYFMALCGDCSGYAKIFRNKSYVLFLLSGMGFGMGLSALYLFLPDFLIHNGVTHQEASFSVSLSGIGGIVSRILAGIAGNDPKIGSGLLYATVNGIMGILCFIMPIFTTSVLTGHAFGFMIGLYTGGTWTLFNPITYEIVGLEAIASGIGTLMFFCGLGSLVGAPLAGMTYKASGSYYAVYIFAGMSFFFCTFFAFLSTTFRKSSTKGHFRSPEPEEKGQETKVMIQGDDDR